MIKSELERIVRSAKGRVGLGLILAMPAADLLIHIFDDVIRYGDFNSYHLNHPVYAGFLCGSAIGKFSQILFFWLLPLYFLALYSDTVFDDERYGYGVTLMSRAGYRGYFRAKFAVAFLVPFGLIFSELVVNLLLCVLLFHRGYQFGGYEDFYTSMGVWFAFGIEHPYIYYGVYILSGSLVCGLSGVLGLCCSFLFKSRYLAYFFAFLVWLAQMMLPFGVGHAVQPYVEGGHIYGLVGRNGSGKTMLLRVLCGLVFPDSGTVTVDGRRLHRDIPFPPGCGAVIEDVELLPTGRFTCRTGNSWSAARCLLLSRYLSRREKCRPVFSRYLSRHEKCRPVFIGRRG